MKFYANRQISTGLFLPAGGKGIGGHTKQEPSSTRPPRLFMQRRAAIYALRCYLQGKWYETGCPTSMGDWDYGLEPRYGTKRDATDFETVEIELQIGQTWIQNQDQNKLTRSSSS